MPDEGQKKCPPCEVGAPAWMVTYGDMVTLLLCFFVLLIMLMEPKKPAQYQIVMDSLKRQFGSVATPGRVRIRNLPTQSKIPRPDTKALYKTMHRAAIPKPVLTEGEKPRTSDIRPGTLRPVAGSLIFAPEQATIKPQVSEQIDQIAKEIRGYTMIIEVRGHTSQAEFAGNYDGDTSPDQKRWDLSYRRARNVMDQLVKQGIREQRIRVVACGDTEPIKTNAYTVGERAVNRRVDIVLTGRLMTQYNQDETSED